MLADLNRGMRRIQRTEPIDAEMSLHTFGSDRIPGIGRVHREPNGGRRAFHDLAEQPLLVADLVKVGMDGLLARVRGDVDELVLVAVAAGWNQIDGSHAKDREAGDWEIVVKLMNRPLTAQRANVVDAGLLELCVRAARPAALHEGAVVDPLHLLAGDETADSLRSFDGMQFAALTALPVHLFVSFYDGFGLQQTFLQVRIFDAGSTELQRHRAGHVRLWQATHQHPRRGLR